MDLITAVKTVYDLAEGNALSADLTDGDERLEAERIKQTRALEIVARLISNAESARAVRVSLVYDLKNSL